MKKEKQVVKVENSKKAAKMLRRLLKMKIRYSGVKFAYEFKKGEKTGCNLL